MDDDVTGGPLDGEDPLSTSEAAAGEAGGLDRRNLLRKSVIGAGVAGLVWSAPRIEGLSVRPDYAAAATGGSTDPGQPFDQTFPIGSDATPGPYTEPGNGFPNLAYGYGWNATGGPGITDLSISAASDCAITVDADLGGFPAADSVTNSPIQPGAPFPLTTFTRYSWGTDLGGTQGNLHVHFTC